MDLSYLKKLGVWGWVKLLAYVLAAVGLPYLRDAVAAGAPDGLVSGLEGLLALVAVHDTSVAAAKSAAK